MSLALQAAWARIPDQVKLAVRDAIEAGLVAAGGLVIAFPTRLDDAKREAVIVLFAFGAAAIAVLRRKLLPYLKAWVLERILAGSGA